VLVVLQAILGKITVESELSGEIVTAHLATAMVLFALVIYVFVRSRLPAELPRHGGWSTFTRLTIVTAAATYLLLLLGAHVRATGTTFAFPDWPLMNGGLLPTLTDVTAPQFLHRWAGALVGLLVAATAITALRGQRRHRSVVWLAVGAAVLFPVQALIGASQIWLDLAPWTQILHLALAAAIWGLLWALVLVSHYSGRLQAEPLRAHQPGRGQRDVEQRGGVLQAYVALTKPRIIELLLVTTLPTMVPRPAWRAVDLADGRDALRRHARRRRGKRDQHVGRSRHRRRHASHATSSVAAPCRSVAPRAGFWHRAERHLVRVAGRDRQPAGCAAEHQRNRLLRLRLHAVAQAQHAAEHRDRRGGRLRPGARRLGGGDRHHRRAGTRAVRHRLLLDAAALLGTGAALPHRLRGGACPDAAGGPRRGGDGAPDRPVQHPAGDRQPAAVADRRDGADLSRLGNRARRPLPCCTRGASGGAAPTAAPRFTSSAIRSAT